jgi:hypothetical protein
MNDFLRRVNTDPVPTDGDAQRTRSTETATTDRNPFSTWTQDLRRRVPSQRADERD